MAPSPASRRRKSIAVATASSSADTARPVHKRRAHSIAPGDKVSPRSRARRLKGPRKSILKASQDDTLDSATSSRRVSFAPAIDVRLFEKDKKDAPEPDVAIGSRRRSSMRAPRVSEYGEMSMDLDGDRSPVDAPDSSPLPRGFLDDLDDYSDEQDDDMDITQTVPRLRRRSSTVPDDDDDDDDDDEPLADDTPDDVNNNNNNNNNSSSPSHVEYSAPLEQPLSRPRRASSAAILALAAVTNWASQKEHASYSEDMDLDEAQTRLMRYRESLGLSSIPDDNEPTSALAHISEEDSLEFDDDYSGLGDGPDDTVNMTRLRPSEGGSEMDLTTQWQRDDDDRGHIEDVEPPTSPTPPPRSTAVFTARRTSFAAPTTSAVRAVFAPAPISRLPVPTSPTKLSSPRKAGSAAFAGPVSKPVPKRYPTLPGEDVEPVPGPSQPQPSHQSQSQPQLLRSSSDPAQLGKTTNQIAGLGNRSASHESALRRPSGYFAQRRSLGLVGAPAPAQGQEGKKEEAGEQEQADKEQEREEKERVQTSPSGYIRGSPVRVRHTRTSSESATGEIADGDAFGTPPRIQVQGEDGDREFPEDDDFPPISIEQFMSITDVSFIQDIFVPPVPIRPSLAPRGSLSSSETSNAEFFVAMYEHLPQLELYGRVVEDMERWSAHAAEVYAQAETDALRVQPSLFREFVEADEEIQRELVGHLKRYQRHCRAKVKLQWRQWRLGWVNELKETADKAFEALTSDAQKLEALNKEAQALLGVLRADTSRLDTELEEEQAFASALAQDDPEYLDDLKATIAEQESVLQAFRDEKADNDAALESLERRIAELEASNQAERDAIARLGRPEVPVKDVPALRDELAMLENLTTFKITRVRPNGWGLLYANRYIVDAPASEYVPQAEQLRVALTRDAREYTTDDFPALTELAMALPRLYFACTPPPRGQTRTMKHVTQFLRDFWAGCAQLRTQLRFLAVKWPLTVVVVEAEGKKMPGLRLSADVVLHSVKGKCTIEFVLEGETLVRWPFSVQDVACAVIPVYGSGFDCERICADIVERISEARPDNAHGCIVDACIVATAEFARRSRGSTSMNTSA